MADDDQPPSELVAQIPLPVVNSPRPSSSGLSLANCYPVYFSSALPEPIAGCSWLERFSTKAVLVELIGTEPARCLVATQDGQLFILQSPAPPTPGTPKPSPSSAQPGSLLSSFSLQSNPPHPPPAPHSRTPSHPLPSHELPTSRKASATVSISIPSSSTDQLIRQPLLTPSSPRSAVHSPPSPSQSPLDPLGRKQSIDSLWQGSLHHRTPSQHTFTHPRLPVSGQPPRAPVPPPAPQLPLELIPRSSTLLTPLPYADRIIKLFPINPHLAITLTRFGTLAKVSLVDGHIVESISLSPQPQSDPQNRALIEFDDAKLLTPPEQLPQNNVDQQDEEEDGLILCVSSEGINILVSYQPFFTIQSALDPTPPPFNPTHCTTRILADHRDQHGWLIDLISLTWTGVLLERTLKAELTKGIWTVTEPSVPTVVRDFGRELELEQVGVVVDGERVGVWSGGRFWVLERSGSHREGAVLIGDAAGLRVDAEEDKIVRLFFLGGAGALLITQRHVSLFAAAGLEQPRNGWAQARLHPVVDSKFTLPSSRRFEAVQNRSLFPPASAGLLDLVSHMSLLTVDYDQSTGQRTISELVFNAAHPAHPALQELLEPPKITHVLKHIYHSPTLDRAGVVHLTCSVWLEDNHHPTLLVGDSQGRILVYGPDPEGGGDQGMWKLERSVEEERLGGGVSALYVDENWVLAGSVSGEIGIWERVMVEARPGGDRLRLVDRIVLGAVPVEAFGWLAERWFVCVLMDGTLVVWTLGADGVPEAKGELAADDDTLGVSELWSNGQELIVFYRERRLGAQRWFCSQQLLARLERSEAEAMISLENQQTGPRWTRVEFFNSLAPAGRLATCGGVNVSGSVAFNTLSVKLRAFMESIGVQAGVALAGRLWMVRLMVSQLLPWGIDAGLDECAEKDLGIERPSSGRSHSLVVVNGDQDDRSGLALFCGGEGQQQSSGCERTYRLLNVVVLLRVFLNEGRYERHASEAIVGLARLAGKPTSIGEAQSEAWLDLKILVKYWLDRSGEIREAARLLFGVRLGSMADEEIEELVASWKGYLPIEEAKATKVEPSDSWAVSKRVGGEGQVDQVGKRQVPEDVQRDAMLLIGLVVAERYKLLSSSVLKELSMAVFQTLSPAGKAREMGRARVELLAAALEVCSKAFEIIQNYIDAIELVRGLFGWATGRGGDEGDGLKGMAKQACLHVASVNTPLFMTTLSYDLMTSQEAAERMSTMRLVVFMVRKRPLVLHGSLPRLAEAVVKSLDPTAKQMRAQTQTGATVILHELVRTYPSVAFHGASQRLAVGTPEGATVIYDLRTATRLSVLDSYRRPVTACSFSADGHRLVTVSLDEGRLEVWKTGGGLLQDLIGSRTTIGGGSPGSIGGMFRFGGAPTGATGPSGSAGISKPFKSLPFNVGEEALMTVGGTLEWVRIDWLGLRSCRLRIRESSLTFSC